VNKHIAFSSMVVRTMCSYQATRLVHWYLYSRWCCWT